MAPKRLARMLINARLFVYGTLLSTAGHPMGARLRREARLVGPAAIRGRLYSLGHYPGLVEAAEARSLVHGELYALDTPAVTLRWLDTYEGILPGRRMDGPYERCVRTVQLGSGGRADAWVYLYRRSVRLRPQVEGGRWIAPQS